LDLSLSFDSNALVIKEVHGIGLGNSMSLASNSVGERLRVALYGLLPLAGSGTLLSVTVEALEDVSRRLAISIDAEANEGVIPVRVRHRAPTVGPRSRSGPVTR
jgi:predicted ATP-dependent Lon-type protease